VRKITVFLVAALVMMFAVAQIQAGEGCSSAKGTKAKTISADKAGCSAAKGTSAKLASMTMEDCAKLCGMTAEECAKACGGKGNCSMKMISVKGMTCTGCEGAVSSALAKVEGVNRVLKVDHKEGYAVVCAVKDKCCETSLTKAISAKGFTAEIIPAVATAETTADSKAKAGCDPKACAASKKGCSKSKGTSTIQKTSGSN